MLVLWQDGSGDDPGGKDAKDYAKAIKNPSFPVVSDETQQSIKYTPYKGDSIPGMCVLSPEMEILACKTGHGTEDMLDIIREDAL
jgi:hypothetical protein